MEARETEYKGVVFRSKSEAVLARTFDLLHWEWAYEQHTIGGHLWDFWVNTHFHHVAYYGHQYMDRDQFQSPGHFRSCIYWIELKPRRPTNTYVKNLKSSFFGDLNTYRQEEGRPLILYGSPWEKQQCHEPYAYTFIRLDDLHEAPALETQFGGPRIPWHVSEEAKTYRFDLAGSA